MNTFGQHLKVLRESKQLSQDELAKKIGYARENLNAIENDRRACPKHLYGLLAAALEVPIDLLAAWKAMDDYGPDVLKKAFQLLKEKGD